MNAHHLDHPEGKHVHVHSIATQWVLAAQLILSVSLLPTSPLSAQTNATVHGHVFRIGLQTPIEDALIIAWPCGQTATTDRTGRFEVECSTDIDSLTFVASAFETHTIAVLEKDHVDVWLSPLEVQLSLVSILASQSKERETQSLPSHDLMATLDRTPGLQSLDLGAGMIQPVIRGLYGSRVAVLEDGVPQQGGRWGADHGILADPELFGSFAWIPGGGHLWMGPGAIGGGMRLKGPERDVIDGENTRWGVSYRMGDNRSKVFALHNSTQGASHWYAGLSGAVFGDQNVPQSTFSYLGRTYALDEKKLPNTAGRATHAVLGYDRLSSTDRKITGTLRASEVVQGLFPGIVGVPRQGDLAVNPSPFAVALPAQKARRLQATGKWETGVDHTRHQHHLKGSISWFQREELAPPHAHGWGPEPDSNLSLHLEEWTGFIESVWKGAHGSIGLQAEGLNAKASGWEFLVPDHTRLRTSAIGEGAIGKHTLGLRTDLIWTSQAAYSEPLYDSNNTLVGSDIRSESMRRFIPGGMLSWQYTIEPAEAHWKGTASATAYSRAPSNYELGANGIHHGTFRFEQGQANLRAEKALEGRFQAASVPSEKLWGWSLQTFFAVHQDFISLNPSASFAPISHAGQVYVFQAMDVLRTGVETQLDKQLGPWTASASASLLGQWEVQTGLGLPFTTPPQLRMELDYQFHEKGSVRIAFKAIGNANLTARNEAPTEGTSLWESGLDLPLKRGRLSLAVNNLFNVEWLDHTSAYRALGLVAQGRWIQIGFASNLQPKQP